MVVNAPWLRSVLPATFTPGRNVDLHATIAAMQKYLAGEGIEAAFVNGTTGEFPSLSVQERKDALQAWVDAAKTTPGFRVVAHIGHCAVGDAVELAKHAAEIGADAIAAVPPWYFRYMDAHHVATVISEIAAAAPQLPFLYYHIPMFTKVATGKLEKDFLGDGIYLSEVLDLAQQKIPNFAGCKYTSNDLEELARVDAVRKNMPEAERFKILLGGDTIFLKALEEVGIDGAIGSSYNLLTSSALTLFNSFNKKDLDKARSSQKAIQDFFAVIAGPHPIGLAAQKHLMKYYSGIEAGSLYSPNPNLSEERLNGFVAALGLSELKSSK